MVKPRKDLTGQRFNRLTVVKQGVHTGKTSRTGSWWECICDCGTEKLIYTSDLTSKKKGTKSCGCLKKEINSKLMKEMRLKQAGTVEDRFNTGYKINEKTDCWEWVKLKDKDGYGIVFNKMVGIRTHRYSYEKYIGAIPKGMLCCHKCDNPSCVNPVHLFIGTNTDNLRDMIAKGRDRCIGIRNWNAKLTEEQVIEIRKSNESYIALAKQYHVTNKTIGHIQRNVTWRHLL